jgi:two-component system NarL family sensor kinase
VNARRVGIFLALPLLLAIATTGLVVKSQFDTLLSSDFSAEVEHALDAIPELRIEVSDNLRTRKEAKLRGEIQRALAAIEPLRHWPDVARAQEAAKKILGGLSFDGGLGYFYVYTLDGTSVVHPVKPHFVGRNLIAFSDADGKKVIAELRDIAMRNMQSDHQKARDFLEYKWENPVDHRISAKLGYAMPIPEWGWMVGTGTYFYDVESVLIRLQDSLKEVSPTRSITITMAVTTFLLLIAACGYILSRAEKWEETHTNAKKLADQSENLARFVHGDVISKFSRAQEMLEDLLQRLPKDKEGEGTSCAAAVSRAVVYLDEARALLRSSANEAIPLIRHPPLLDHGDPDILVGKIASVCQRFTRRWTNRRRSLQASVSERELMNGLSEARVSRILQFLEEALLNCEKHAEGASKVEVIVTQKSRHLALIIRDDGKGFNLEGAAYGLCNGRGLRDLQAHAAWLGGHVLLKPVAGQNEIVLTVPLV